MRLTESYALVSYILKSGTDAMRLSAVWGLYSRPDPAEQLPPRPRHGRAGRQRAGRVVPPAHARGAPGAGGDEARGAGAGPREAVRPGLDPRRWRGADNCHRCGRFSRR